MTIPPCPCGAPEQWRAIPGWEGLYEVSDHGQVRSLDRYVQYRDGRRRFYSGRLMQLRVDPDGRRRVSLCRGAEYTQCRVSTLVLLAFAGPRPEGTETCHNDGDASNDHVGNLRFDTHTANVQDTLRHGRNPRANKTHCKWGHAFSGPNLITRPSGRRLCRACQRAAQAKYLYGIENLRAEADECYALIMAGQRRSSASRARSVRS
jgi:hypothetical protein